MSRRTVIVALALAVILMPMVVHAATTTTTSLSSYLPIVPCGGTNSDGSAQPSCTPCDIFLLVQKVVNFVIFGITGPIAAFMVLLAGGMMLLGGATPSTFSRGKAILTNTLFGVAIILLAWVVTTFLIKMIAPNSETGNNWYNFTCPQVLQDASQVSYPPAPVAPQGNPQQPSQPIVQANQNVCTDTAALAKANGVPSTPTNAPSLTAMMTCIERDPVVAAAVRRDAGRPFTYDHDHTICNFTRGQPICGSCSHGAPSCHYGGKTGSQGAMAVDYSWNSKVIYFYFQNNVPTVVAINPGPNATPCSSVPQGVTCHVVSGQAALFDEIYHSVIANSCAHKLVNFEGDHTHVSTADCDVDGSGAYGRVPQNQN